MRIRDILPSARFALVAGSIFASGGLIIAAYLVTHYVPVPSSVAVSGTPNTQNNPDWQATLQQIQAASPNSKAPQPPSADKVSELLNAASSDNLTDTVGRTLFVNLSAAKAQGLGDDTPTQDQLVQDALSQISAEPPALTYSQSNLTTVGNTQAALTTFGNAFMAAVAKHTTASYNSTIYIIGTSTDNGDPKRLSALAPIGLDYKALARDLAKVAVPTPLAPLDLQVVNNFERMGELFPDMQKIYTDPLRALAAFQLYDSLNQETANLFINIAQEFGQNGILFNKDDPGAAWSTLVP